MNRRWGGVLVLAMALTAYGCGSGVGEIGGMGGTGGTGGSGGSGGSAGTGGSGGSAGAGGSGGSAGAGGSGGMADLCMGVDCGDGNECTQDVCNPADGTCSNPNETDDTSCDFGGLPGVCAAGVCEDAMRCAGVDCGDGNECTEDLCDPATGTCSNPNETDGTDCDFGGLPGVCAVGVCEDAMLCAGVDCGDGNECTEDLCDPATGTCSNPNETDGTDCDFGGLPGVCAVGVCEDAMLCAGVDCSDGNECTEDVCDPQDGTCSNPNEADGTDCDFGGFPGVCAVGVCEDAMLCAGVDCSDGNECTEDVCDPQDGTCSNPNEADGTDCDAAGNPGSCQTGMCVALCMPAPGLNVTLPTSGASTPVYTDMADGFTISAVNCGAQVNCTVAFSVFGIGANTYADKGFDPGDSLLIAFFDENGIPRTASNVSLVLSSAGTAGTVDVSVDGGMPTSFPAALGATIAISPASAHEIQVTSTSGFIFWKVLQYDHDCL